MDLNGHELLHDPQNGINDILRSHKEQVTFQNLDRFIRRTDANFDAKIDCVHFFSTKGPIFELDFHKRLTSDASRRPEPDTITSEAELFIIEEVDLPCLRHFLSTRVKDSHRESFLRFVNEYLHDHPSPNFTDVDYRIRPVPSVQATQQYEVFTHLNLREFDRPFRLSYTDIQDSARVCGGLRKINAYGPLNPVQRTEVKGRRRSNFPPLAVSRAGIGAWFDCEAGRPWRTGVILVDKRVSFGGLVGKTKPSYYVVGGNIYLGHTSTRSLLRDCFQNNPQISTSGIPAPFTALQDIYGILGYDWMMMIGFITRDLNSIDWALQGGDETYNKNAQELYRTPMQHLFAVHRRIIWYCELIQGQLDSCRAKGKLAWNDNVLSEKQAQVAHVVSKNLVMDFEHIKMMTTRTAARLEKSISFINGEANINEVERANSQSKIVLALAVVGGFFLPISTIATIFSMADNWGPGKTDFGTFWAICIPISILVMMILVMIIRWSSLLSLVTRPRRVQETTIETQV